MRTKTTKRSAIPILIQERTDKLMDTPWGGALQRMELTIRESDGEGIRLRWAFGKKLLEQRTGEQLPRGLAKEVMDAVDISRTELTNRMRFAKEFPTQREVDNAIVNFRSWYQITSKAFAKTTASKKKRPAVAKGVELIELKRIKKRLKELDKQDSLSEPQWRELDQIQEVLSRIYDKHQSEAQNG